MTAFRGKERGGGGFGGYQHQDKKGQGTDQGRTALGDDTSTAMAMATNPYDEVAIYQFPSEIFHSIFSFVVTKDHYESERSGIKRPIASFTLSQVSQRWRTITHDLPQIWTDIRIFHFRDSQCNMVSHLIHSRTKGFPLSIALEYDQPLAVAQTRNYWETLLTIKSCSSRWKYLHIGVNQDLFTQICRNFGAPEAPLLQQLELVVHGPRDASSGHGHEAHAISPLYLEIRNAHILKRLVLIRIRLRTPSPAYMGQLETLTLDNFPALEMLDRPLIQEDTVSTHLRNLTLIRTVLALPQRSYLSEYTSFLTTLSLSNVGGYSPTSVHTMFDHLATITLRELSISHVDHSFLEGFLNSLQQDSQPQRYPRLHKLHLEDIADGYSGDLSPQILDFNFPKLEVLDLFNVSNFATLLKENLIFPLLHTLCVRGARYKDLCDVIDLRAECRAPLTTLEVDTPQFLDLSSLAWLQRKVPNFQRTTL